MFQHIDEFTIFDAADNAEYSASLGLTNTEKAKAGAVCTSTMSTTLLRLEIVTLKDVSNNY